METRCNHVAPRVLAIALATAAIATAPAAITPANASVDSTGDPIGVERNIGSPTNRNAAAQAPSGERLCDTQFEDCREPLLELIRDEMIGIDVAFWYMQDARYVTELIRRFDAGVPVRLLVDERANKTYHANESMLDTLKQAGIPMRHKVGGDVLHFKMMLFHGQNIVEFSKANFDPFAFNYTTPDNYTDEAVFFTDDDALTNSFRRRFDDRWTDTADFRDYANITNPPVRTYPLYPIDPSIEFVPMEDFADRAVSRFDQEAQSLDALVFRVTDPRQADAVIRAVARGVPVRIITDPGEYRNPARVLDSKQVDRMFMGGAQIKISQHQGPMHEAAVVLHGLGEVIFGSSNWTPASAFYQDEHNYFYNPTLGKPWFFDWFADQFTNKWNDAAHYVPFEPLPPGSPTYLSPTNAASGLQSAVTLTWDGGPWSHLYDVYFGPTTSPPLVAGNIELGSPEAAVAETYTVRNLQPGTTYYWRIVDRTWAQLTAAGPTWSFTTASAETPAFGGTPAAIPGMFEAENFDTGGQGVAYYDTKAGNSGGAYRSTDVDIAPAADTGSGYYVGWTKAGEWLKYSVNVATSGTYTLETRVANVGAGATFRVEVDGVDRTGSIVVPDTGAWDAWQTLVRPGIPLTAGQRVLRVVFETMASGGGVGNFNWFRLAAAPSTPAYGGTPAAIPGTFEAEHFDNGGAGISYRDTSIGNSGGAYRATDVDLEATSDAGGGYNVGWVTAGEWLNYTIDVASAGAYRIEVRVASPGAGGTFHIEANGVDATGPMAVPGTGGWQVWTTVTSAGAALTSGVQILRLVMDTAGSGTEYVGNFNWIRVAPE